MRAGSRRAGWRVPRRAQTPPRRCGRSPGRRSARRQGTSRRRRSTRGGQPVVKDPVVVDRDAEPPGCLPWQPADLFACGDVQPGRGLVLEPDVVAGRFGDDPRPPELDAAGSVLADETKPFRAGGYRARRARQPLPVLGSLRVVGVPRAPDAPLIVSSPRSVPRTAAPWSCSASMTIARMRAGTRTRLSLSASGLCLPASASVAGSVTVQPCSRKSPVSSSMNTAGQLFVSLSGSLPMNSSATVISLAQIIARFCALPGSPRLLGQSRAGERENPSQGPLRPGNGPSVTGLTLLRAGGTVRPSPRPAS